MEGEEVKWRVLDNVQICGPVPLEISEIPATGVGHAVVGMQWERTNGVGSLLMEWERATTDWTLPRTIKQTVYKNELRKLGAFLATKGRRVRT